MNEKIILIGGGTHAAPVIDTILAAGDIPHGILDSKYGDLTEVLGVPVLGDICDWEKYTDFKFVIAIGKNRIRHQMADSIPVKYHTVIHPTAIISRFAKIGEGTVVLPGAVINTRATVGKHCIINTGSIIEHDCTVSDYVHTSPAVTLSGTVSVGVHTHIGTGAKVSNNLSICAECTVGAGAVVVRDITEPGVYVGVPAKKIK